MRTNGRAWIAVAALSTLLLPAVGSVAGTQQRLEDAQSQLDRIRDRISTRSSQAASLDDEIDSLNAEILGLRTEISKLDSQIDDIEWAVRSQQAKIDNTQAEIDTIEEAAVAQAIALYKSAETEAIDALLDSASLSELDARAAMLGVAAEQNTGALVRYSRLRAEIEAQQQDLFNKKAELDAARRVQARLLAESRSLHARLATKLASVEDELGNLYQQEGDLEAQAAALTGELQALQAKRAVTALGTSAQGFIWPLNGAITSYYGERWGRMHTGIDIDGYTGQPVVAAKAGRVVMASAYSGYGNAVIIDHGGGIATLYAHLSAFDVSSGEDVAQGTIVGLVGCTGSCTGDHLHFEVRVNGSPVDPLPYLP
ncbi:MAG: murein hydrolase activator EnvC family protein [Actinomycetota bacterium]